MPSLPHDDSGLRATGRTTAQIKSAAKGATYIMPSMRACSYYRDIAADRKRPDIKFIGLESAKVTGWARLRGIRGLGAVVLDHACWNFMEKSEWSEFLEHQAAYGW